MNTNFTSPSAVVKLPFSEAYIGTASHQFIEGVENFDMSKAGDPSKAALRVVEAVDGTGMLAGRDVKLRLPVGSIGSHLTKKGQEYSRLAEEFKDVWQSV